MKQETLELLAPLLAELRANAALREIRPAAFELDGREFLHFHEDERGVTADVRLTRRRVSLAVSSVSDLAELLGQIQECLAAVESRELDRRQRARHRARH